MTLGSTIPGLSARISSMVNTLKIRAREKRVSVGMATMLIRGICCNIITLSYYWCYINSIHVENNLRHFIPIL